MNTTDQNPKDSAGVTQTGEIVAMATIRPGTRGPGARNDNAIRGGIADTTEIVARPGVVRTIHTTLRGFRVPSRDMPDAIADVQTRAIAWARTRAMPATVAQWKALTIRIARRWALDRRRAAKVRRKYDAGLCEEPDAYLRPTLHWEHRDPVDTKRYIAILKDLFDSGQMPEDGQAILQDAADEVPHADTAAELGVSEGAVRSRLFRMRARFRARLATLGLLTLVMMLLLSSLVGTVGGVGAPAPSMEPAQQAAPAPVLPAVDAGEAGRPENRPRP